MTIPAGPAFERRQNLVADARRKTGIDEKMIDRLVRAFYARIRCDPVLGPIFAARIVDWEPHLQQMNAFWESVTLMTGSYRGKPMQKHLNLPVGGADFDRWLSLFEETAHEVCPPQAAQAFIESARRVAESLELGIANAQGIRLATRERLA